MTPNKILNRFGNPMVKNAWGLYGSIYEWPNQGRFHNRVYINQDTETGAGFLNRDLLVRWAREVYCQSPFIRAGVQSKALFSVGKEYDPVYCGQNDAWGSEAIDFLKEIFYPNACMRGRNYNFKTMMFLESTMLDIDGDMLEVFGEKNGIAKVQIIPCHRIYATISDNAQAVVSPTTLLAQSLTIDGPSPNTIISDGVIYDKTTGEALGYNVINTTNIVTSMFDMGKSTAISTNNAHLQYDPEYFDRGRGLPSLSSGILQALSLQEIEQAMVEKIKIEAMVALIEKNPEGLGPYEEGQAYQQYLNESPDSSIKGLGGLGDTGLNPSAQKGLRITNGPGIRYLTADGDLKTLSSNTPGDQTLTYITKQESQVLQSIGIPHALIFSHDGVQGRMSDGVVKLFNAAIEHRQELLDTSGRFMVGYALAKAIKNGDLPPNDEENLATIINFTHPKPLSLNSSYDRNDKIKAYQAGTATLKDTIDGPVDTFIEQIEKEQILFLKSAQNISKITGVDLPIVLQSMRDTLTQKSAPVPPKVVNENTSEKSNITP